MSDRPFRPWLPTPAGRAHPARALVGDADPPRKLLQCGQPSQAVCRIGVVSNPGERRIYSGMFGTRWRRCG